MLTLPNYDVPLLCIDEAAIQYHVPAKLIISVLKVENGRTGKISLNKNGTYDIGLMQINSRWLIILKARGISEEQLKYDPCVNVKTGAWILSKQIAHSATLASGVGDYHSHTYRYKKDYFNHVQRSYSEINGFLL